MAAHREALRKRFSLIAWLFAALALCAALCAAPFNSSAFAEGEDGQDTTTPQEASASGSQQSTPSTGTPQETGGGGASSEQGSTAGTQTSGTQEETSGQGTAEGDTQDSQTAPGASSSSSEDPEGQAPAGTTTAGAASQTAVSGAVDDAQAPAADDEQQNTSEDGEAATDDTPYSTLTPVEGDDNVINTSQLPDSSFLYDISLSDLAGANFTYDGQTVQIIGEALGDIIKDGVTGTHVWVTLASTSANSYDTVIAYMTTAQASVIDTLGTYDKTGTVLQVRGTFHLACSEHEGQSDIHVTNVSVISRGQTTTETFSLGEFKKGIALVILGGLLIGTLAFLRQRLR